MSNRVLRVGFFAMPFIMSTITLAACGEDEPPVTPKDAGADVPNLADRNVPDGPSGQDARPDSPVEDGGSDANVEAEASLPPLCVAFPNVVLDGGFDADDPFEGSGSYTTRYDLIALRALLTGAESAAKSCAIGSHFQCSVDDPGSCRLLFPPDGVDTTTYPDQIACLSIQLASLAGCLVAGQPIDYDKSSDQGGLACVGPGGDAGDVIQLGFRNPQNGTFTAADVDQFIEYVRQAAIGAGMPTADADRLKALLEAQRNKAVGANADAGDGGFSQPCQ